MNFKHKCSKCQQEDAIKLKEALGGAAFYLLVVLLSMFIIASIYTLVVDYPHYDLMKRCEAAYVSEKMYSRSCCINCQSDSNINISALIK